ncbi:FecR family protein [Alistipes sp. ZOR0009]|jgi:hypothetical protein|uniref:FecR family protein n=1 Tax=Alistipes sp. ZOR0009 TaxID=1339253 RepID=UPI00068CEC13|nr:FecR family protein [Alistipes sp. ZOR0009]
MERIDLPEKDWNYIIERIDSDVSADDLTFQAWLSEVEVRRVLYDELLLIRRSSSFSSFSGERYKKRAWATILEKIEREERQKKMAARRLYIKVAASLAPFLFLSFGYWLGNRNSIQDINLKDNLFALSSSIEPGSKKARLVLQDGTMLDLGKHIVLKESDGTEITNAPNSMISYINPDAGRGAKINTLIVPKGGEYRVLLADGTKVWLNSGSILRYPTSFNKKERMVQLEGEAYFEVKKNPKVPFAVKVRGMSLAVFGTSFNVNSYEPGKGIGTTLVEGKVTMRIDNGKEYVMRPHEHITYNLETDTYSVLKNVDVSLYTSWKDGVFRFENQRLEDITNRLSRWYSCEVVYNDNSLRDLKFTGVAKKNEPIDHLLNLISLLKDVDYDVKDGVVFISKRRN